MPGRGLHTLENWFLQLCQDSWKFKITLLSHKALTIKPTVSVNELKNSNSEVLLFPPNKAICTFNEF